MKNIIEGVTILCDHDREMMELILERWIECMEKNRIKVSRAKT